MSTKGLTPARKRIESCSKLEGHLSHVSLLSYLSLDLTSSLVQISVKVPKILALSYQLNQVWCPKITHFQHDFLFLGAGILLEFRSCSS
jgi:hypothetical protein